ncbi:MAG: MarR family winged helix-turn-helix transcriptional regulator [Acidiferrobacterales bacterium]
MSRHIDQTAITAWARLLRAQKVLLEEVEGELKDKGLPPLAWYDVLFELYRHPDRRLRQFEIGAKMLLSKFNLSRLVDRLEKSGLVRRDTCPEDQRGAYVVITADGKRMLKKMWPTYEKSLKENFSDHFSKQELTTLSRLLVKIC